MTHSRHPLLPAALRSTLALILALSTAAACRAAPERTAAEPQADASVRLDTTPHIAELAALRPTIDTTPFTGTVVVHDPQHRQYCAVHAERATLALIPASTFKIPNSLISLELGLVAGPETVLPWDGRTHERSELNRDFTLAEAFRISAVPHYQALAREVGAERMQRFLDTLAYGNRDIGGGVDAFWLTGDLRISPLDQLRFLERLHAGRLPLSSAAQQAVREIMEVSRTPMEVVRGKTGWARLPDGQQVGWWVGWVERGADVYFFATAIESPQPHPRFGATRLEVTRAVLERLGIQEAVSRGALEPSEAERSPSSSLATSGACATGTPGG